MTKKTIVVTRYWIPITLWSVFEAEVVAPALPPWPEWSSGTVGAPIA